MKTYVSVIVKIYLLSMCMCAAVSGLLITHIAHAQTNSAEVITEFASDIRVNTDSTLNITETITVINTGEQIKRGIYRDFPTKYSDRLGNKYTVGFSVTSVTRNGAPEDFHVENQSNGKRIYIGNTDRHIPTGEHIYKLSYTTNRQLGFFPDHDELYWNVTGNGWSFPILKASARVTLPAGIPAKDIRTDAFTGPQGSQEKDFTVTEKSDSVVTFASTNTLQPGSGLTIVTGWPKGFVAEPDAKQKALWFLEDNKGLIVGFVLVVLIFAVYVRLWFKHGRDPKKRTIVPQYEAPAGLSAAMISFIQHMSAHQYAFTASVLSLGIKGQVRIVQNGEKMYTLEHIDAKPNTALSNEESALLERLFKDGSTIEVAQANQKTLAATERTHGKALKETAGKQYFVLNLGYIGIGIICSILSVFLTAAFQPAPFVLVGMIVLLIVLNIVFAFLLPRRTEEGKRIWEHIQGLKLFMSVAEKDRLKFHNPPEQTPALFEKLLPYAVALGVETAWAKQFESVFAQYTAETGHVYAPVWFIGTGLQNFSAGNFSENFGSTISSSSTPPGSSSGFGGGGSSGGGGGGGGGGGW
ncbi:MAG: DUF2207 domain-containing protein [Candidatus Doudnabacteria bacterium]|nr:DUF2207 domain-containing protein [Candidatus Doudnabacteria bacterium]